MVISKIEKENKRYNIYYKDNQNKTTIINYNIDEFDKMFNLMKQANLSNGKKVFEDKSIEYIDINEKLKDLEQKIVSNCNADINIVKKEQKNLKDTIDLVLSKRNILINKINEEANIRIDNLTNTLQEIKILEKNALNKFKTKEEKIDKIVNDIQSKSSESLVIITDNKDEVKRFKDEIKQFIDSNKKQIDIELKNFGTLISNINTEVKTFITESLNKIIELEKNYENRLLDRQKEEKDIFLIKEKKKYIENELVLMEKAEKEKEMIIKKEIYPLIDKIKIEIENLNKETETNTGQLKEQLKKCEDKINIKPEIFNEEIKVINKLLNKHKLAKKQIDTKLKNEKNDMFDEAKRKANFIDFGLTLNE